MAGGIKTNYNGYFKPVTEIQTFTVQQQQVPGYTEAPIPNPNDYWTLPINGQNRAWNVISGPWLQSTYNATGKFNPYTYAPNSAHILWTDQLNPVSGGLIGGDYGSLEYERQTGFSTPIIMNGYVFYNGPASPTAGSQFYCMSLTTGKIVWSAPGSITTGQILDWRSLQSKIEVPYLWSIAGSTWNMYDANTGRLLISFPGAPSGTAAGTAGALSPALTVLSPANPTAIGANIGGASGGGAVLVYEMGTTSNLNATWMTCWNSTQAIVSYSGNAVSLTLPPAGGSIAWKNGIQWNVTIPHVATKYTGIGNVNAPLRPILEGSGVIIITETDFLYGEPTNVTSVPIGAVDENTGQLLWYTSIPVTPYQMAGTVIGSPNFGPCEDGVFTFWNADIGVLTGINAATGAQLWSTHISENDFANTETIGATDGYSNQYFSGYDGYMHCINLQTGNQTWASPSAAGGFEMPQPNYPISGAPVVADGKVYATTAKGYETEPLYRGHLLYCWDAYTGQQLWNISGQITVQSITDGIMLGTNAYDGLLYAFGKGPTATTVSSSQTKVTAGSSIIISGTVTDQSPGAKGTPAISDQSMTPWMEYVYMDQPYPTQATGVNVVLTAIDPNNNYITIGNATSDLSGTFGYQWTPPNIPGKYTIIATFNADNSYYGSCAETIMTIGSPAAASPVPTATPTSVADMYFVPAIAGLFVLIIVVAIVLALLMLRKRP